MLWSIVVKLVTHANELRIPKEIDLQPNPAAARGEKQQGFSQRQNSGAAGLRAFSRRVILDGSGRGSLRSATVARDASMPGQNQPSGRLVSLPHVQCSPLPPKAAFLSQKPITSRLLPDGIHICQATPLLGDLQELLTSYRANLQLLSLAAPLISPTNFPRLPGRSASRS